MQADFSISVSFLLARELPASRYEGGLSAPADGSGPNDGRIKMPAISRDAFDRCDVCLRDCGASVISKVFRTHDYLKRLQDTQ